MILLDRMVLVMLKASIRPVDMPNILLVCGVLDKRYDLGLRLTSEKMSGALDVLVHKQYIECCHLGYRLQPNGEDEFARILRQQSLFVNRLVKNAGAICPIFRNPALN